jgi:hypothetical protein
MTRRSGVVAALLFTLSLTATFVCPARAAAVTRTGNYSVYSTFSRGVIPLNGTVTLRIDWSSGMGNSGITLADQLPAGLVVAAVPNVTEGGWLTAGTVTANPGSSTISLNGFSTVPLPAYLTVDVTGTSPGPKTDNVVSTSDQGGPDGVFRSSIDVVAPPSISTAFTPGSLATAGVTSLGFTISNPAGNDVALSGVGFSDTLAGLTTGSGPATACGGTLTITAPSTIALSGGAIAPGASCSFSVSVTGAWFGYFSVSTQVTSDNGGTGNTSTAHLSVGYVAPTIGAAFGSSSITAGGSTSLGFTITNPNSNSAPGVRPATLGVMTLSGIGFTDTLPAGLVVATPNGLTGGCGGGTITAPAGGTTISLAGATLAAGASCTFSVVIVGVSAGSFIDSTGPIGSTEGGPGTAGTAGLTVVGAPAPTPTPTPTLAATPAPTPTATPTLAATPAPTPTAAPTLSVTPPPSSTAAPSSSGDDAGLPLALLACLVAASYLTWRTRIRPRLNDGEK